MMLGTDSLTLRSSINIGKRAEMLICVLNLVKSIHSPGSPRSLSRLSTTTFTRCQNVPLNFWDSKFGAGCLLLKSRGCVCHQATADATPALAGYANTILDVVQHTSCKVGAIAPHVGSYLDRDGSLATITAPSFNTRVGPQEQTLPVDPTP